MPTANVSVTTTWTKVADVLLDPVLIQCSTDIDWEVAAVDTDTTPAVIGHRVRGRDQAITRDLIGAGYLYARILSPSSVSPAVFVVSGDTPT